MKLVTYESGNGPRAGLAIDSWVADLELAAKALRSGPLPASLRQLLLAGDDAMARARAVATGLAELTGAIAARRARTPRWLVTESEAHLLAPVPDPGKIVCLGLNYKDHCAEQSGRLGRPVEPPPDPVIFAKFATSLTGPYDPIELPPASVTRQVDYEVELAVVIGRTTRRATARDAMGAVAGYMVMNDVSARDCQFADKQWVRAKSFDTFAPCGPWLVTADEIADPHRLRLWTAVNGQTLQDGSTRQMIFRLPRVISYLSRAMTFEPGDIISTGTPAGVGIFREPPLVLKPGDTVECGIESIGTLCNPCVRA